MTPSSSRVSTPSVRLLMTLSGTDAPGITSELTRVLAENNACLIDIAQAVIQKLLSLSLIFEINPREQDQNEIIRCLTAKAIELKLQVEFQTLRPKDLVSQGNHPSSDRPTHYALTLIGDTVSAGTLHRLTRLLAKWSLNIDLIKKLSEKDFTCFEMIVSSHSEIDSIALRKELLSLAWDEKVDIALQSEGLYRRAKRLVVLDMDSTLIQGEIIDELARAKGVYDEVAKITHAAMQGALNYDESLTERCRLLAGLARTELESVYQQIELTPGAEDLVYVLKKLGYKIALISGGFLFFADRLKEKLELDFAYANTLEIKDGKLTGRVIPPIVNAQRKSDLLEVIAQQERIELDQVIAIGDGANDLLMLEKAGLGIAFNAKPLVRERADLALSQKNLRSVLYLLGLSARDVEEVTSRNANRL